jgi:hypothetical protein
LRDWPESRRGSCYEENASSIIRAELRGRLRKPEKWMRKIITQLISFPTYYDESHHGEPVLVPPGFGLRIMPP